MSEATIDIALDASVALTCIAWLVFVVRRSLHNTQHWVAARLRDHGSPVEVQVRRLRGTWNPSNSKDLLTGERGRAVYTVDDAGMVRLCLQPRRGPPRKYVGPMPQIPPRRNSHLMRLIVIGYTTFLVAGFALGTLASSGSLGTRLLWGCGGLAAAMIFVPLSLTAILVGASVKHLRDPGRH